MPHPFEAYSHLWELITGQFRFSRAARLDREADHRGLEPDGRNGRGTVVRADSTANRLLIYTSRTIMNFPHFASDG